MTKRLIILISILAVVLSLAIIENVAIETTFETMNERLQVIDEKLQSETAHTSDVESLIDYWESKRHQLYMLAPHLEIKCIEVLLHQLKNAVEYKKYFEASEYAEMLISQSKSIPKSFMFCMENIL